MRRIRGVRTELHVLTNRDLVRNVIVEIDKGVILIVKKIEFINMIEL
jgi:hypothetical protein